MNEFRGIAFDALATAKPFIEDGSEASLRHAAVNLRMAIEALVYERAQLYKDDLPSLEYLTWQPRKLLLALLEIDPHVDQSGKVAIGLEASPGEQPKTMHLVGEEVVLSLAIIKKHYDALGSYLHVPTLQQIEAGYERDWAKAKTKIMSVAQEVQRVLDSSVWNVDFRLTGAIECYKCGTEIKRRYRKDDHRRIVNCSNDQCAASYELYFDADNGVPMFAPQNQKVICQNNDCKEELIIWNRQLRPGSRLTCRHCKTKYTVGVSIYIDEQT